MIPIFQMKNQAQKSEMAGQGHIAAQRAQTPICLTPKFRHWMPLSGPVYRSWDVRCNNGTNSILDEKYTVDFELAIWYGSTEKEKEISFS